MIRALISRSSLSPETAIKLLLALIFDAVLLGAAIVSASAQTALLLAAGGVVVVVVLLFFQRWRAVGVGMVLWAALGFLFLLISEVFFTYHE